MDSGVFRQKNIDRINSPESLNEYVKVTNPSVWIILIGVVIFIIGALVFGITGKIDTNVNTAVLVSNGVITAYVEEENIEKLGTEDTLRIDGITYSIKSVADRPVKSSEVDEYVLHKGNMEYVQWLYPVTAEGTLKDGVYSGVITVERISPISFVFN